MAAVTHGKLLTMPVLIVNMGGEMVYILEQRLQAQKIPESKGQKVLSDVVRTMYYPRFIDELFKPQEMYSIQSTRQIFDKLAHSSIMRLNESSMDKLFDLMATGFKYQIVSCSPARQLVEITLNHLEALKRQCQANPQLIDLLNECVRQMGVVYGGLSVAGFIAMRQSLCAFFQDRKVKVSLFLHDQTQNQDGSIAVKSYGTLPVGHQPLGTVRYFEGGYEVRVQRLPLVSSDSWTTANGARTTLGHNLYEKERSAPPEGPPPVDHAAAHPMQAPPPPAPPGRDVNTSAAAVGELNALASLVGAQPISQDDHFKLENLFGSGVFTKDTKGKPQEVIMIDGAVGGAHSTHLDTIRQEFEGAPMPPPLPPGDDDLLDLMDAA